MIKTTKAQKRQLYDFRLPRGKRELSCVKRPFFIYYAAPLNRPILTSPFPLESFVQMCCPHNVSHLTCRYQLIEEVAIRHYNWTSVWNCLSDIVPGSPRTLILSSNNIERLPPCSLSYLTRLEALDVSHNKLTHVSQSLLWNLTRLKTLDLSWNHLSDLEEPLFDDNPNLGVLHLHNNDLVTLPTLVSWLAPGHHLAQCWNIVNLIRRWNINRNSYILIQENTFENVV